MSNDKKTLQLLFYTISLIFFLSGMLMLGIMAIPLFPAVANFWLIQVPLGIQNALQPQYLWMWYMILAEVFFFLGRILNE
jgi:hypothetical protein